MATRSVLVIGPPLAGKSTWVREQAAEGDLVYDFDLVHSAISLRESHQHDETLKPYVFAARDAIFEKLTEPDGVANAWIISTSPKRERVQEQIDLLDAQVKPLLITQEEAHLRADDAKRPQVWHDYIDNWFRKNDWMPDDFRERLFDADAQRALVGRSGMAKRQRELERRFISAQPVELRAGAAGQPAELHGYAAVFNQWAPIQDFWGDGWQEQVTPGAYAKTIGEADIRALFNHDPSVVLGRNRAGTLELTEDGTGLRDVIRPPDNEWGRPVLDAVRRGDVTGQSIAFRVIKEKWERPERRGDLAKRTILEAALLDVSIVTYPVFEQTSIVARSVMDADASEVGVIGQAFRLARLAEHGYPLAAEERAVIGAAVAILGRVSAEPVGDDHSAVAQGGEPGNVAHSTAARARSLRLMEILMEVGDEPA